ncbi:MAG: hypothetical protein HY721_26510 [Planctomycetes bacterium]|nr:hypothetical protein [Planctomycetota bacterium]
MTAVTVPAPAVTAAPPTPAKPYLWEPTGMKELGVLGEPGDTHIPFDLNDSAQIVGVSGGQAVLWEHESPRSIGNLPCFVGAEAAAINESGQIVGFTSCVDCLVGVVLFRRADTNGDDRHDVSDAVTILSFLFLRVGNPACPDVLDANDDGAIDISDGIGLLSYLFLGGFAPPTPFSACGEDPTRDGLRCLEHPLCSPSCR